MSLVTKAVWLLLPLVAACINHERELAHCDQIARAYFYDGEVISLDATLQGFSSYDTETQYSIFVCATQYMHPPLLQFTPRFAAGGEVTAELLKAKLRSGQDGRSTMHILEVFVEAQNQGVFRASSDPELMSLLVHSVDANKESPWHDRSARLLQEIEQQH